MKTITGLIDTITEWLGKTIAWLTLVMMIIMFAVVLLRYGFNVGSIALQESVTYLHALIFLLASGYTLKHNAHVRVDIFYRRFSRRRKAIIDFVGGVLLLIPMCCVIAWFSWDYVIASWQVNETSSDAGGLPFVYLLKTLILAFSATLIFQGVCETLKNFLFLLGHLELTDEKQGEHF